MPGRILMIGYYFPPMGGAGIGRPFSLFKELPELGWECDFLTVKNVAYRQFESDLLANDQEKRVYRSGSIDPQRLLYMVGVREVKGRTISKGEKVSSLYFPDPKVGWVRSAVRLGRTLLSNRKYDLILSTSPPISSHLVGLRLADEFKIPWVADFRDFWTIKKPENEFKNKERVEKAYRLLDKIKSKAAAVTSVNEMIAEFLGRAEVIRNSFDKDLVRSFENKPESENYVIGLFGTFDQIYTVEPLLKVLDKLRKTKPKLYVSVKLLQIGDVDKIWLERWLSLYKMTDKIEYCGFRPRLEAIKLAARSSLFYFSLSQNRDQALSPGRSFYLLASGRPILAAGLKSNEFRQLLTDTGNTFCFDDSELDAAALYLAERIEKRQVEIPSVIPDYARPFSSEKMTGQFADLFEKIKEK